MCVRAKLLQSCCTLCYLADCSPPGSSVHGILQTRILEWVAMSSSRGSSRPRDRTLGHWGSHLLPWQADSLPLAPPGKPQRGIILGFSLNFLMLWYRALCLFSLSCVFLFVKHLPNYFIHFIRFYSCIIQL